MRRLDIAVDLRVRTAKFAPRSYYAEHSLDRAVRPLDFSYKHKAERTINLVLTSLSCPAEEGATDGLKATLGASPAGMWSRNEILIRESLTWTARTTTNSLAVSDVLIPPQLRAIEGDTGADLGDAELGYR